VLKEVEGNLPEIYSMISEMSIFISLFRHKTIDSGGCTEVFLLPKVPGVQQVFMT